MFNLDNKPLLFTVIAGIVTAVVVGVGSYFWLAGRFNPVGVSSREKSSLFTPPPEVHMDEYEIGGKVTQIEPNRITFKAGLVIRGPAADQNVFGYVDRVALVTADTNIQELSKSSHIINFFDIKVGEEISVYSNQSPYDLQEITAVRIDVKR